MGHEFAGEIVEAGKKVKSFAPGDKVVSPFTTACGECYYCKSGLSARCIKNQIYGWVERGVGLQGAQAEYVRVPLADSTLMEYDQYGLTGDLALLAGDIFSTGYYGALLAQIKSDDVVAVVGCGPVGLMAVLAAQILGAKTVIALDSIEARLKLARQLGAFTILPTGPWEIQVSDFTEGRGVDAVIEAVGNESAQSLAYGLVRPGGIIATIGVHTTGGFSFKPADVYNKNLTYKSGRCPARSLMGNTLPLIKQYHSLISPLITHRMSLASGPLAYELFDGKKEDCVKIVFEF
jgi:threonine dehydrogenase-like Zn-dependent dehydrogenase